MSAHPPTGSVALVVRRTIRAATPRVFAAWTRPEHLMRWWGPEGVRCPAAEVDLRVGGRYRIANRMPDGQTVWISGAFERIEPPRLLVYSWVVGDAPQAERVTVRFEPVEGGTEVIVVHEHIPDAPTRASHRHGWVGCLDGLQAVFDGADPGASAPGRAGGDSSDRAP